MRIKKCNHGQGNALCSMHYAAGIYATIRLFYENNLLVGIQMFTLHARRL